jgi:hypothetical protein
MLYYQWSTLSKTQEAEKMGKKTVLTADQITRRRKVFTMRKDSDTVANHAADNSRINPSKSG